MKPLNLKKQPRKSSDWLPALTREGFTVHHANPPNEVSMYKWLVENEADQVSKQPTKTNSVLLVKIR